MLPQTSQVLEPPCVPTANWTTTASDIPSACRSLKSTSLNNHHQKPVVPTRQRPGHTSPSLGQPKTFTAHDAATTDRQPDCHSRYQLGDGHSPRTSIARCQQVKLSPDHTASNGRREVSTWLPIHEWTETEVWQHIRASGVPYHPAYDAGMTRLSCSLCILGSRADLLRAARLRPDLAAEYARIEDEIGHRFRNDMSTAEIITGANP
ncbi:phosphoadenosine phosphosulfate reductase domain-containing protein [Amycolatopsis acididurans]|uniref:phosphoadenosine phosphosulfate reductase domain-containing protein n=1 Tax=Amycolatopsis acididurans TaxID=2724524 RepID=UPI0028B042A4|nr:phosphoadenosine phosphosulfate reductase family protein [Amycolatopsis acididurans]